MRLTEEQQAIINSNKKNLIVSASAGSGKTFVVIEQLKRLISEKSVPLSRVLVLTFTKAAAGEMRSRLAKAILECEKTPFLTQQLDELALSDISTIHAFCEKLLKKYASLVSLPQNFIVLDEKEAWAMKNRAFGDAFNLLARENDEDFNIFYMAFKKNKSAMLNALENFASFLESQAEGDDLADYFERDYLKLSKDAEKYLNNYLREELFKCKGQLLELGYGRMEECYKIYGDNLKKGCEIVIEESFARNAQKILAFNLGRMPSRKTEYPIEKEVLGRIKEMFSSLQKLLMPYSIYSPVFKEQEEANPIIKALVKLFKEYRKNYSQLKMFRNALDFSNLERYAKSLLENEDILKDLQERYLYIFVDEYQDTNPLQEFFVKKIGEKGRFIGVGDPKQGIYGFRNATMEIMKRDIENFSKDENGEALFLNGNFRSDKKILDFVNNIFDYHMTSESVGIDYAKTSRLKGLAEFKDDGFSGVEVDVIMPQKEEPTARKGVYSVKEDSLGFEDKSGLEIMTIASHIEEYLSGRIYDSKREEFRDVTEGDIVVLFRKRSPLMQRLASYLENMGYNVLADISKSLLDNGEIASILSFVKLAISFNDEVALASAMASVIGGFTMEELSSFKGDKYVSFKDKVFLSTDEKVSLFFNKIDMFKNDINIRGLTEGLKKLLNDNFYYTYLNSLDNSIETKLAFDNLFQLINSGNYNYNLQGLIDFLEEGRSTGRGEGNEHAITLTTIHATKGLEYPIVILAGCGESMGKSDISQINFSKRFGLGTNLYDLEENCLIPSMTKLANKISSQKREYIDELMIFYVALTRAKNHLVLTGILSNDSFKKLYQNKNYLALVLNSYGDNFGEVIQEKGCIVGDNVIFNFIDSGEETPIFEKERENMNEENSEAGWRDRLKKYIDFIYPNKNAGKRYKNSVTSLMENDRQIEIKESEVRNLSNEEAIIRGNAYHEALKILPFEKINSLADIDAFLNEDCLTDGYYQEIDKQLLLKNVFLIKSVLNGQKAFKEREFISSCTLSELGLEDSEDKVIVQGIVDLFSIGKKNILIDYKYSSINNDILLRNKYIKQIKLYEKALEKAFNKKINEKYLLSIKNAKLIKIEE